MWTKLHWVEGPWPGKLALAGRPRGGEWLPDELASWQRAGVNAIFSLLTTEEEKDLELVEEAVEAKAAGMAFLSYPILDRQVPASAARLARTLEKLDEDLEAGKKIVLHCRQGIGRSGLVAACLLLTKGASVESALRRLTDARGVPIPETLEQRRWIEQYATTLAPAE